MKKMIYAIMIVLCMMVSLAGCSGSSGIYEAGTYTASAEGYGGDVSVEVEFDKDSIVSVTVTDQNETVGIGDRAIEELPSKMVETQTWEVDGITSATVSCDAIKAAVKDCINQAKSK